MKKLALLILLATASFASGPQTPLVYETIAVKGSFERETFVSIYVWNPFPIESITFWIFEGGQWSFCGVLPGVPVYRDKEFKINAGKTATIWVTIEDDRGRSYSRLIWEP